MCLHETGLWSLWAQFEKGTQPSKFFSRLSAQSGKRHTLRKGNHRLTYPAVLGKQTAPWREAEGQWVPEKRSPTR